MAKFEFQAEEKWLNPNFKWKQNGKIVFTRNSLRYLTSNNSKILKYTQNQLETLFLSLSGKFALKNIFK